MTDYDMPVMNGLEATLRIKELIMEGSLTELPIIGVSAYSSKAHVQKCLDNGMSDYIPKPFTFDQVTTILWKFMPLKIAANAADAVACMKDQFEYDDREESKNE